jgi:hypothetical protein
VNTNTCSEENTLRMTRAAKLAVAEEICRMQLNTDAAIASRAPRMVEQLTSARLLDEFYEVQAAWLSTHDDAMFVTLERLAPAYLRWLDPVAEARDAEALKEFKAARRGEVRP